MSQIFMSIDIVSKDQKLFCQKNIFQMGTLYKNMKKYDKIFLIPYLIELELPNKDERVPHIERI